jgi:methenyltetrahydrofolate cyclohydrolase
VVDTQFINELASKAPTPGGGGASAYAGALACALSSMVGNLTSGKKKYADVEEKVQAHLLYCEDLRDSLLEQIDADAQAFEPVAAAYRMPSETESEKAAKNIALQAALMDACKVPLRIMELCSSVLDEALFFARCGSKLAISDAGASAILAKAALEAAALNVYINTSSMDDKTLAKHLEDQADDMRFSSSTQENEIVELVYSQIRK